MRPNHPKPPWESRKPILPPILISKKSKPSSPRTLSRTAEGISIPWNGGDLIADKKSRKSLENAKKIRAKSVSTGTDHAFEILGEYSRDQPVRHLREFGMSQPTTTSQGNLVYHTPTSQQWTFHRSKRESTDPRDSHPPLGIKLPTQATMVFSQAQAQQAIAWTTESWRPIALRRKSL